MDSPLTAEEIDFLDKHSGTTPNRAALDRAIEHTRDWVPSIDPASVPHFEAIRAALDDPHPASMEGFLLHGRVGANDDVPVIKWLRDGNDLGPVIALALAEVIGL